MAAFLPRAIVLKASARRLFPVPGVGAEIATIGAADKDLRNNEVITPATMAA